MKQHDFDRKIEWINKIVPLKDNMSVLDVGCSEGTFLSILKKHFNMDAYGVEPSETFSTYAKEKLGLNVVTGFFSEKLFPSQTFDLITLSHVLEHMHDPIKFLTSIGKKLKKQGFLFVQVPDLMSPRNNLRYHHLDSTHLYMYSSNTIKRLLARIGLVAVASDISESSIKVIAKIKDSPSDHNRDFPVDDYRQVKRIITTHIIKWMLTAEWKEQIKKIISRIKIK
jgi:ubiquinone/menaquinone biosynthesis C-methylase UbiE